MTPTQIMRREDDHATPCSSSFAPSKCPYWPPSGPCWTLVTGRCGTRAWFEIDNRDRRPPHRRRCRTPASHLGGASVRSSHAGDTMAETGSTRVRRRINTLLHQSRPKGGRRVPRKPPPRPPPLLLLALAKHGVHSMTPRVRVGKLLCRASADSIKPPPFLPPSPLLFTGRQTCSATLQATAHAVGCRLAWLDCGRSATPPFDYPISTDSGKKKKKEEGSTRNVREGSMAKWGCHVVDSKPRSAVSLHFFFSSFACQHLPLLWANSEQTWEPGTPGLVLPRRGWAPANLAVLW